MNGSCNNPSSPSSHKHSQNSNNNLRRSKRSRKCKGDMEVIASSFSIIKHLKLQVNKVKSFRMNIKNINFFKDY